MVVAISQIVTAITAALRTPGVVQAIAEAVAGARTGREEFASKAEVNALKADVADIKTDMVALKADVADLKADLKLLKFGYGPVILALLVKLTFFP